jgi:hypothetical protein
MGCNAQMPHLTQKRCHEELFGMQGSTIKHVHYDVLNSSCLMAM